MSMSLNLTVAALCLVTSLLWGAWGFLGKIALAHNMPPQLVFFATTVVSVVIAAAMICASPGLAAVKNAPSSIFALLSGAAMAAGSLTFYYALARAPASVVVVSTSSYPLFTLMLSAVFLGERLTTAQLAGAGLAIVGLVLVLSTGSR
jgi:bacterial/archaeal transporter family protein